MTNSRTVAIIGGGLAGLSAAYDLGRSGFQVTLIESDSGLGGLAGTFLLNGAPVDKFYHFVCGGDDDLTGLLGELGIDDKLQWRPSKTSFFYNGRLYPFGTPMSLLRFDGIPFWQRVRFGLNIVRSRYRKQWADLDEVPGKDWLIDAIGEEAYRAIWDPLLRVKFGEQCGRISAAWVWHRIHRVARSRRHIWQREKFGYLEQGCEVLIDALRKAMESANVTIRTGTRVERIEMAQGRVSGVVLAGTGERLACDHVISTVALPALLDMAPDLPEDYRDRLRQIGYVGVVCMVMQLRRPVTDSYWVNVNDPHVAFNGFIEYTNLNPCPHLKGSKLLYIPFYLPTTEERYRCPDRQLFEEYAAALSRVNPDFDPSWVESYHVFRAPFAQAVCVTGFSKLVPDQATPIRNLWVTDSTQFYPEDRSVSAAIRVGRQVARRVAEKSQADSATVRE